MKVALAFTLVLSAAVAPPARAEVKAGDHFVELDAKSAAGKRFRLKDMAGKWVLFTFGASWCQPCHKELPAYDKIAPKLGGKVLFVAVNIDDDAKAGKEFVGSLALRHVFPVFMPAAQSEAMKGYDPDKMPSTFVIDPQGVVRLVKYGFAPGDEDRVAAQLADLAK
ncbi:MAG TPA: TlpA disulfide reductase family protein [Kofleriaceae bacterium]|jgi:thiol-disulfide isomerase/thioredoxin